MKKKEIIHIFLAILVLTIVISFSKLIEQNYNDLGIYFLFALGIISINICAKKLMARTLDSDVTHEIWRFSRFGFKPDQHFKKGISAGVIFPLVFTAFSLGMLKVMTLLTYNTKILKRRAAKRFGLYSFTEMTDWHTSLIGGAGILATLLIAFLGYWLPLPAELGDIIFKTASYYAFFNLVPFSKLDGSQIFFGSRVLWFTLSIITLIFTGYSLSF
ncbi:hypothetical protein CXT76_00270 [Candidatus Parvarchaeota archaeon]|jgi:Zn-dependent protease|nr:MAG: hypothetical protein CXT76_00270 [Candidatus Parvarchaeota archaeon]HIG52359.1 hypothetical protein [Candidatus Pacearchaeota archaeon]